MQFIECLLTLTKQVQCLQIPKLKRSDYGQTMKESELFIGCKWNGKVLQRSSCLCRWTIVANCTGAKATGWHNPCISCKVPSINHVAHWPKTSYLLAQPPSWLCADSLTWQTPLKCKCYKTLRFSHSYWTNQASSSCQKQAHPSKQVASESFNQPKPVNQWKAWIHW